MTDRGASQVGGSGPGRRAGRVKEYVAGRPGVQRLGAVAAVLVLLTAPFGGFESASERDTVALELDQPLDLGPFVVTIESVKQLTTLPPVLPEAEPDARLLVIRVEATNHTDRAEYAELVRDAFSGTGTRALPWEDSDVPALRLFDVNDAVELPATEFVNPGQTYEWALVLRQRTDVDLDAVELVVTGYHFEEEDTVTTLDENRWAIDRHPVAEGHVPIEVEE